MLRTSQGEELPRARLADDRNRSCGVRVADRDSEEFFEEPWQVGSTTDRRAAVLRLGLALPHSILPWAALLIQGKSQAKNWG